MKVSAMTTAEILAEYNLLTGKSVKKFSSRAAGEKQLEKARSAEMHAKVELERHIRFRMSDEDRQLDEKYGFHTCPSCGVHLSNGVLWDGCEFNPGEIYRTETHQYECQGCGHNFGKPKKAKSGLRSTAVAESWNDEVVASKRSRRDSVLVDGVEFRSVKAAFVHLNLPLAKHIRFRMSLKELGSDTFEFDGVLYNFKIA